METLLLTWTISPNKKIINQWYKSTSLNPEQRYFEYLDAIIYYISQSNFQNIVFCENSNYLFKDLSLINGLCKIYNKKFELLQFNWNYQKTLDLWYWYWDWEIIDYAIDNSSLLKKSINWYKISGRYICININEIILNHKNSNNIFFKWVNFSFFSVCSAFFKTNNNFYYENLYKLNEKLDKNISLETIYYSKLRKFSLSKTCWNLKIFPKFSKWNNMINITFILKSLFKTWLSSIWSKISFIFDKILLKND